MITVYDQNRVLTNSQNSKGAQLKFKINDTWYKIDELGYEGLSEVIVSNLLAHSNAADYVKYEEEQIQYGKHTFLGCKSLNFKDENTEIVTVSRLFESMNGYDDVLKACKEDSLDDTIYHLVSTLSNNTGLTEQTIGQYLTQIIELDSLTLNDDRHFNNIAFLYSKGHFSTCPIFDNGAAFLSDEYYYSSAYIEDDIEKMKSCAKPFMTSIDDQREACERLFGQQLIFEPVDIERCFENITLYPEETVSHVKSILEYQIRETSLIRSGYKVIDFSESPEKRANDAITRSNNEQIGNGIERLSKSVATPYENR